MCRSTRGNAEWKSTKWYQWRQLNVQLAQSAKVFNLVGTATIKNQSELETVLPLNSWAPATVKNQSEQDVLLPLNKIPPFSWLLDSKQTRISEISNVNSSTASYRTRFYSTKIPSLLLHQVFQPISATHSPSWLLLQCLDDQTNPFPTTTSSWLTSWLWILREHNLLQLLFKFKHATIKLIFNELHSISMMVVCSIIPLSASKWLSS